MAGFGPKRGRSPPKSRKRKHSGSPEARPKKRVPLPLDLTPKHQATVQDGDDDGDTVDENGVELTNTTAAGFQASKVQANHHTGRQTAESHPPSAFTGRVARFEQSYMAYPTMNPSWMAIHTPAIMSAPPTLAATSGMVGSTFPEGNFQHRLAPTNLRDRAVGNYTYPVVANPHTSFPVPVSTGHQEPHRVYVVDVMPNSICNMCKGFNPSEIYKCKTCTEQVCKKCIFGRITTKPAGTPLNWTGPYHDLFEAAWLHREMHKLKDYHGHGVKITMQKSATEQPKSAAEEAGTAPKTTRITKRAANGKTATVSFDDIPGTPAATKPSNSKTQAAATQKHKAQPPAARRPIPPDPTRAPIVRRPVPNLPAHPVAANQAPYPVHVGYNAQFGPFLAYNTGTVIPLVPATVYPRPVQIQAAGIHVAPVVVTNPPPPAPTRQSQLATRAPPTHELPHLQARSDGNDDEVKVKGVTAKELKDAV